MPEVLSPAEVALKAHAVRLALFGVSAALLVVALYFVATYPTA